MKHHKLCRLRRRMAVGNCECVTIIKTMNFLEDMVQEMAIWNHHQPGDKLCAECYTLQRVVIAIGQERE